MNVLYPNERWKQKIEKWLQAKTVIYGGLDDPLPDQEDIRLIKSLFDPIAFVFVKYFKNENNNNIPKIDIICLYILYNISKQKLIDYGWYFLNPFIVWESPSSIKSQNLILSILNFVNINWDNIKKDKRYVTRSSNKWLLENKFKLPSLSYIIFLVRLRVIQEMLLDISL